MTDYGEIENRVNVFGVFEQIAREVGFGDIDVTAHDDRITLVRATRIIRPADLRGDIDAASAIVRGMGGYGGVHLTVRAGRISEMQPLPRRRIEER